MRKANALLIASLMMLASVLPIFLWNPVQPERAQTDLADVRVPGHNDTIWAGKYYGFLAQGMQVQGSAKQVVTGDLNSDGFPDIAVLSQPDGAISLFFWNNTMKNFSLRPNVVFTQFTQPKLIAIGDVNNDSINDIAIVWYDNIGGFTHLSFLVQTSPGIFNQIPSFPDWLLDRNPIALIINQFDSKLGNDVAVIGRGSTNQGYLDLFFSNGTKFEPGLRKTITPVESDLTAACAVKSATANGPSELAVGNATGTIKIFRQPLNKTNPTSYTIQSPGEIIAMGSGNLSADLGYSPSPGLLSLTKNPNRTYIFKSQGGTYDSSRNDIILLSFAPVAIALTDFNHDNWTDFAIVSNDPISMTKTYTRNTASGAPWPETSAHVLTSIGNASSIAAADFDRDGQIDICESSGSNSSTSPIAVYFKILNKPLSPSDASLMLPASIDPTAFAVGRFNSNSDQLVVLDRDSSSAKLFNINAGILTENWSFQDSGGAPVAMAKGKLNGDSHDDLVIVDASDHYLRAYLGGILSNNENFSAFCSGRPTGVALGDLNGDGIDEGIVTTADSKIDIFASTGSSFSKLQTIGSPASLIIYSSPKLAHIYDEGRLDIVAGVMNNSTIELFHQLPDGNFPATCNAWITTKGVPPSWLAVGDFDWNGLLDIASGYYAQSNLTINYQTAPRSFSAVQKDTNLGRVSGLTAGDFTDRGRMDLLVTMTDASMAALYMSVNQTGIADDPNETLLLSGNSTSALAWDYNSDGRKDICILSSGSKAVNIWFQLDQPPRVFIDSSFPGTEGKSTAFSVRVIDGVSEMGNHTVSWQFGDGGTATVVHNYSATHIYANNGAYQVNVTVTDPGGLSASATSSAVIADTSPVITIYVSPAIPHEGQITALRANATAWDPITRYAWRVDGTEISNGTSNSTTHRFPDGTHLVKVIVWDSDSLNSSTKSIAVTESPPTATINAPAAANAGATVVLTADFSDPSNVDPVIWFEWDFNYDSVTFNPTFASSSSTANHIFTTPGGDEVYTVALRVNDSDGSHNMTEKTIAIDGKITSNFSNLVSYRRNTEDTSNVTFDAAVILTLYPDTYTVAKWDWGDGTSTQNSGSPVQAQDLRVSHRFSADKDYNISLFILDDGGMTCYLNATLKMIHPHISVENLTGEIPHLVMRTGTPIQFEVTTVSGPIAYVNWSLDGGAWTSLPLSSSAYSAATPGSWAEGTHQIILRAQDSEGNAVSTTIQIVIDNTPPSIQISQMSIQSVIGDDINITVTVTDANLNPMTVYLNFTDASNQISLVQMHYAGNGSFWVVIPSPSRLGTFEFNVTATDLAGNTVTTTTPIQVTVVNGFWTDAWPFIALAAVLAAIAFIGLIRIEEMMAVDETFVIYNDGRLISHQTRRLTPDRDSDILSGMFVAVQEFVKDSFKEDTMFDLRKLEFGGRTVLVEKGKKIYLAVVLQGRRSKLLTKKMREVTKEIETKFQKALENWEGDVSALRGVKDITNKLNTRLISRIRGGRARNN